MAMRNSYNSWQNFQTALGAKPRSKSAGALRNSWAHRSKNAYKSVCLVRTRNDDTRTGR